MAPRIKDFEDLADDVALISCYGGGVVEDDRWMMMTMTAQEQEGGLEEDDDNSSPVAPDSLDIQAANQVTENNTPNLGQPPVSFWNEQEEEEEDDDAPFFENQEEDGEGSAQRMLRSSAAFDEDDDEYDEDEDMMTQGGWKGGNHQVNSRGRLELLAACCLDPHTTLYEDLEHLVHHHGYGIIPDLLQAIMYTEPSSTRLVCLALRLLTDCARGGGAYPELFLFQVFTSRVLDQLVQILSAKEAHTAADWWQQECAALVIRTLTAHEVMDPLLLSGSTHMIPALAMVALGRGGAGALGYKARAAVTEQARLHATIALMNLSCGPANKAIMASNVALLHALKAILLDPSNESLRLKASVTVKNLSSLESNDVLLIQFPGLVRALGQVIWETTTSGASLCTINCCMCLMNLSISKHCKRQVFETPGVMQALMQVLKNTSNVSRQHGHRDEKNACALDARVTACSVLSNLAIGYENKSAMFHYHDLLDIIADMALKEHEQVRSKVCSILWSLAAEKENQVPMVRLQRPNILAVLIRVAGERKPTEARQKCVAALALLAESADNVASLLRTGALQPLLDILNEAGTDPSQWHDPTASWCVTCLVNMAQAGEEAVPSLCLAGVVELLSPLVATDHEYQSLKAAMAVTLCCFQSPDANNNGSNILEDPRYYTLLRRIETVSPRMTDLLFNTLQGRGGEGYKFGVFTLSSSVACVAALASGPGFIQERICTQRPVLLALLRVLWEFGVDHKYASSFFPAARSIVGGGPDDYCSAVWATKGLYSIIVYLLSHSGANSGDGMDLVLSLTDPLLRAFSGAEQRLAMEKDNKTCQQSAVLASKARHLILASASIIGQPFHDGFFRRQRVSISAATHILNNRQHPATSSNHLMSEDSRNSPVSVFMNTPKDHVQTNTKADDAMIFKPPHHPPVVRTFVLPDEQTDRQFIVPVTADLDTAMTTAQWCFRRGRFCGPGETPDASFVWTISLHEAYEQALARRRPFRGTSTTTVSGGNNNDEGQQQSQPSEKSHHPQSHGSSSQRAAGIAD